MSVREAGGGGVDVKGFPLQLLLQYAFQLKPFEIVGAPKWVDTARYDIEAKVREPVSRQQAWLMFGPVLGSRFRLKTHRETIKTAVLELSVSRRGKLQRPKEGSCFDPSGPPPPPSRARPGEHLMAPCGNTEMLPIAGAGLDVWGGQVGMTALVSRLKDLLERPIVDKTDFTETFDFDLKFARNSIPLFSDEKPSDLPGLLTALQEQLGLKLKDAKGEVEVLVVDQIEPPTPN
jgi:uncharacterized protein (TIGR03435 family)